MKTQSPAAEKTAQVMKNLDAVFAAFDPAGMVEFLATTEHDPRKFVVDSVIAALFYLQRDAIREQLLKLYDEGKLL